MKVRLVHNWRLGWQWFSAWAFALIVFLASVPLPDEILQLLPNKHKDILLAGVALCGLILRFINQSPRNTDKDNKP
mgnify:CR=1 FL=1